MKENAGVSNKWLWLTVPIAILLTVAAGSGVFVRGLYRDTTYLAVQARGQDAITLFAVLPAMVISAFLAARGSQRARLVWLGGLIFLAFVLAPTAFTPGLLPTRHMAGSIVGRSLDLLHYMAIVSGVVFLVASMIYSRMTTGNARPLAARHLLIVLMLLLTLISQFAISPKMHAIRAEVGVIDSVPLDSPARREFDRLHVWSEKFEEAVLLLGLVALYTTAQAFK